MKKAIAYIALLSVALAVLSWIYASKVILLICLALATALLIYLLTDKGQGKHHKRVSISLSGLSFCSCLIPLQVVYLLIVLIFNL